MKLKKLKISNRLITQLQIFKLSYKKKSFLANSTPKSVEILLSKIANVIFQYHLWNKKILFLGFPYQFKKVLIGTKHMVIPEFMWFSGILSNKNALRHYTKLKTKIPKNMFKLALKSTKKADLIIIYGSINNSIAIKESYLSNVPIIMINKKLNILNTKPLHQAASDFDFIFERAENKQFLFSFIKSVLTKAKKVIRLNISFKRTAK